MEKEEKGEVSVRTTKKHLRVAAATFVARAKRHHKQSPGMEWEGDNHHQQPSVCDCECEGERRECQFGLFSLGTAPEVPTLSLLPPPKVGNATQLANANSNPLNAREEGFCAGLFTTKQWQ